jgi:hypothetical protein
VGTKASDTLRRLPPLPLSLAAARPAASDCEASASEDRRFPYQARFLTTMPAVEVFGYRCPIPLMPTGQGARGTGSDIVGDREHFVRDRFLHAVDGDVHHRSSPWNLVLAGAVLGRPDPRPRGYRR